MAIYMAVRGHGRRHNLEMTGSTLGVGLLVAALVWFGVIPASGLQSWHGLFGLVCGPACLLMIVEMLISFNMYSGQAPAGPGGFGQPAACSHRVSKMIKPPAGPRNRPPN
jgi:hypothetical protein